MAWYYRQFMIFDFKNFITPSFEVIYSSHQINTMSKLVNVPVSKLSVCQIRCAICNFVFLLISFLGNSMFIDFQVYFWVFALRYFIFFDIFIVMIFLIIVNIFMAWWFTGLTSFFLSISNERVFFLEASGKYFLFPVI